MQQAVVSTGWISKRKTYDLLLLANLFVALTIANLLLDAVSVRIDLTEEKRFSIKPQTRELLASLEDDVFVEVFLAGDLNPSFKYLSQSVKDILREYEIYSHGKVSYTFTDPLQAGDANARNAYMRSLAAKGIMPTNVIENKDGKRMEKIIFPGALLSVGVAEAPVQLLKGSLSMGSREVVNQSIENIEYSLNMAILSLTANAIKRIAVLNGHGELDSLQMQGGLQLLRQQFRVDNLRLDDYTKISDNIRLIIVAKPTRPFSESDKYKIDQYIMRGGRIAFFIDPLNVDMEQVSSGTDYIAFPYTLNIDDQLFRYGVRVNPALAQDLVCSRYPVVVNTQDGKPQIIPLEWPFFPLLVGHMNHPITRNLDAVQTKFIGVIDTVKAEGVKKTFILHTSPRARRLNAPVKIEVNDIRRQMAEEKFNQGPLPVACLLEGTFSSAYKNRFLPEGFDTAGYIAQSIDTKIAVIADGDIIKNEIRPSDKRPFPLGFDPYVNHTFSNGDFFINLISYLADDKGIILTRNKEIKIRPIDKKEQTNTLFWQMINIILPLLAIVFYGIVKVSLRKRKYARKS